MPTKQPRLALVINRFTKDRIQFLAEKHGRSTSMEIVHAVENWIEQHAAEMADFKSEIPELTEAEKQMVARKMKMAELTEIENILATRDRRHGGNPIPDENITAQEQITHKILDEIESKEYEGK